MTKGSSHQSRPRPILANEQQDKLFLSRRFRQRPRQKARQRRATARAAHSEYATNNESHVVRDLSR